MKPNKIAGMMNGIDLSAILLSGSHTGQAPEQYREVLAGTQRAGDGFATAQSRPDG
jgi:hypothetical protein